MHVFKDVNCGNTNEMKMCGHCEVALKSVFGASTGFEAVASAFALPGSDKLRYEDPYMESRIECRASIYFYLSLLSFFIIK